MKRAFILTAIILSTAICAHADAASDVMANGRACLDRGEYEKAIAAFDRVLYLRPDDARAYAYRGLARLQSAEREPPLVIRERDRKRFLDTIARTRKLALTDLNKAVDLAPDDAVCRDMRGQIYVVTGDLHLALDDFYRAIDIDRHFVDPYVHRGVLYNDRLKDFPRAVADFSRAIALNPGDPMLYLDRAHALANLQRFRDALADYASAIRLQTTLPLAWFDRGVMHYRMQSYGEALDDLSRALTLDPHYASALYWRGLTLLALDRYQMAVDELTRYVFLRPADEDGWLARASAWQALGRGDLADEDRDRADLIRLKLKKRPLQPPKPEGLIPLSPEPLPVPSPIQK